MSEHTKCFTFLQIYFFGEKYTFSGEKCIAKLFSILYNIDD